VDAVHGVVQDRCFQLIAGDGALGIRLIDGELGAIFGGDAVAGISTGDRQIYPDLDGAPLGDRPCAPVAAAATLADEVAAVLVVAAAVVELVVAAAVVLALLVTALEVATLEVAVLVVAAVVVGALLALLLVAVRTALPAVAAVPVVAAALPPQAASNAVPATPAVRDRIPLIARRRVSSDCVPWIMRCCCPFPSEFRARPMPDLLCVPVPALARQRSGASPLQRVVPPARKDRLPYKS